MAREVKVIKNHNENPIHTLNTTVHHHKLRKINLPDPKGHKIFGAGFDDCNEAFCKVSIV